MNFALIGAAGYVAPRHMKAIMDTGHELVAALDPNDSVGVMDSYFPEAHFFTEFERFDRHLEKLRRSGKGIDYLTVCSPNYLHDAHIRFGLRIGANVICEKPVVLNPWNLDAISEIEKEFSGNVFSVLQLRLHPNVIALRNKIMNGHSDKRYKVDLKYFASRGRWYHVSWKGDIRKSGGIVSNIGIHFFDMLMWIFGQVQESTLTEHTDSRAKGVLKLEKADVSWELGVDYEDIPKKIRDKGVRTYRSLTIEEEEFEFSGGFSDLHTMSYEKILQGEGFGLEEARNAIALVSDIRSQLNYNDRRGSVNYL